MELLFTIVILSASHIAAFFAGAHNARRAAAIKESAKNLADNLKR
jgi:hypothetical protein